MEPTFGAFESPKLKTHIKYDTLTMGGVFQTEGGQEYGAKDILNQDKEGTCTATSLIQNRQKANRKEYSDDFQYLLQKKYVDFNDIEGSSIWSALDIGKKIGFLPKELWTHTTPGDKKLPYAQYIAKLRAIPDEEVNRLIALCVDKIAGYATVNNDPDSIATAINESEAGVLCRFDVDRNWWTNKNGLFSWAEKSISPLRKPNKPISGHAIIKSNYLFIYQNMFTMPNTWSALWCRNGSADVIWDDYKPTEVWTILRNPVIARFDTDLKFGMSGEKIVNLQNALKIKGFFNYSSTGYFGLITFLAVKNYQKSNGIISTGYVGPLTRSQLNKEFNV